MNNLLKIFLLLLLPVFCKAQTNTIDSLKILLQKEKQDTGKVMLLIQLSAIYTYSKPDTALALAQQALLGAKKMQFTNGEVQSMGLIANVFRVTGNYPKAVQLHLEALKLAEYIQDKNTIASVLIGIATDYSNLGDERQSINYQLQALAIFQHINDLRGITNSTSNLGDSYEKMNKLDSAVIYTNRAYQLAIQIKDALYTGIALNNLGNIYAKMGRSEFAVTKYRLSIPYFLKENIADGLCEAYLGLAALFQKSGLLDSSLYYAKLSFSIAQQTGFTSRVMDASNFLTGYYTTNKNVDSAFLYQSATIAAKDSLFSQEKQREIQYISLDETMRKQQLKETREEAQTQLKFNILYGGIFTLLIGGYILFRNNRQKQNANFLLIRQKQKVERTLLVLQQTQAQLIQSEKMASLGELTAGIAHEIQNPLNFVNNFSEVNKELIAEMHAEIDKGNYEEVKLIAKDISANEHKINHHGIRAGDIVKGMLQHSRNCNTASKEPTDINRLADEYLRLAYHGLRAKDKSFNAIMKTDFDKTIGDILIVPQDIGRVILNLITNAFYVVDEKKQSGVTGYEPIVMLSTKKINNIISISVKDNGNGIPPKVLDKIFQPFYTTKPTGKGTGLGLSISYDIIKAHGGEIKVYNNQQEGAEFIVILPL